MSKLPLIIWIMAAPVFMGAFVLTVLVVPELAADEKQLIAPAALAGAVIAMPFSYVIARIVKAKTAKQA